MTTEKQNYWHLTRLELRSIEGLCRFMDAAFPVFSTDEIDLEDSECEKLGKIKFDPDYGGYVFVPHIWEGGEEECVEK